MSKVIFTNHLKERIAERQISEDQVFRTVSHPDSSCQNQDRIEYKKSFGHQTLTAVTKQNEKNEYIVLSAWIDPPNSGTKDYRNNLRYKDMKKSGALKKFFLTLLNQLGI